LLEVHRELLLDTVRTEAFRSAIRYFVEPWSVVLDIGSGSGILSFFACEAGARKVIAVDSTHGADLSAFLSRHLGYSDRISVIHSHSTKVELDEPADIIVTETIGAFGFDEHILSTVIDARSRLLRPGGTIIPQRIDLFLVPVEAPDAFRRHVGVWDEPAFGFDVSPLAVFASNIVYVANVGRAAWLAAPSALISADLASVDTPDLSGSSRFTTARDGVVHGFAGWFRATLAPGIQLSNEEPDETSWNHAFLPLERPIAVSAGETIEARLETSDGVSTRWVGRVGSVPFDQMTAFSRPPCIA